ncbi:MAG: NAD(P)H-binding protein [Mycobacterium sp.]
MKFAVIGGTGFIGSKVVQALGDAGHDAVPHSRSTGVDIISGENVDKAIEGANVVINVTDAPSFDDAAFAFFQTSMDNLLQASAEAGVGHFVLLSIVGIDRVPAVAYYRAKVLQENILKSGPVPYSIVRATQFMEFVDTILSMTADGDIIRLPRTPIQPIAAADVVSSLVEIATEPPLNATVDIAGPDVYPLDELGRLTLAAKNDNRSVVTDDSAGLFAAVPGSAITAGADARIATTRYRDWL